MGNDAEISSVFMIFNDERVELESINAEIIYNSEEAKEIKFGNRNFSGTMSNVKINKDSLGVVIPSMKEYTVVLTGVLLPRGNKLPKRKRIRNKWIKKYSVTRTFENCLIKGLN